jgi:hypothetical protein
LALHAAATGRPQQALYLMDPPPGAGATPRLAQLAWTIRNHARPLGCLRMGLPCQLMGTGMAIPWRHLQRVPLATGHIVEDLVMGLALAGVGAAPAFCPEAVVRSRFPADTGALREQSTRWVHGHFDVVLSQVPRRIVQSVRTANVRLLALAIDAAVPPLAFLGLLVLGTLGASAAYAFAAAQWMPLAISAAGAGALALAVAAASWRFAGGWRALLSAPAYVARKVPLYTRFVFQRQVEWVRTRREGETER